GTAAIYLVGPGGARSLAMLRFRSSSILIMQAAGRDLPMKRAVKRLLIVLCAPVLVLVAMASPAVAVSPHFISASAQLSGTNLVVSFKEAGLGTNQLIAY